MSRGQQGIGISAAGMYGLLTTGPIGGDRQPHGQEEAGPPVRAADGHAQEPPRDHRRRGDGRTGPIEDGSRDGARHRGQHHPRSQVPARPGERRRIPRADRHRQPARPDPLDGARRRAPRFPARGQRGSRIARGDQAAPLRRGAGRADPDAQGNAAQAPGRVPPGRIQPGEPQGGGGDLPEGRADDATRGAPRSPARRPTGCTRRSRTPRSSRRRPIAWCRSARSRSSRGC